MTTSAPLFNPALTSEFVPLLPKSSVHVKCPNLFPEYEQTTKKIAIVGEAPGPREMEEGKPFVGGSGGLLFNSLRRYGINRADCFIGNVRQTPSPEKCRLPLSEPEAVEGAEILRQEIAKHAPNAVLLAGGLALSAAFPTKKRSITDWRGSILVGDPDGICPGIKCIPCIHPAAVLRDWSQWPLFTFDLERFAHESSTPTANLPKRVFELSVSPTRAAELLASITSIPNPVALDIEGYVSGVSCISFATSPTSAFIVPLATYNDSDKVFVLQALHRFLSSTTPKILQNQLYDNFVLSWSYKMPIRNVVWDTMLSGWEIYPELPKGLGTQVSVWTREPYYKMDRSSTSTATLHEYCCKDSACTYEIYLRHKEYLSARPAAQRHFHFNMSLLPALLYMEQRGINYDRTGASLALTETGVNLHKLQLQIDGHITAVWERNGKHGEKPASLNINSPKQVCEMLYVRLGYPKQHPKKGREKDTSRVTANIDALLELRKHYNGDEHLILEHILQWRKQDGLRETLELRADPDGRMRCGYNIVGTETGRLTCYGSPTGSGANLTTITKSLRRLYTADSDHWFFQCDLSGADGWTVAAHCALRGDTTMLDDYMYGLKPAKIIALMLRVNKKKAEWIYHPGDRERYEYWELRHTEICTTPLELIPFVRQHGPDVNRWPREAIKAASKTIDEDDPVNGWQYFACKRVQHGKNYGLGKDKMALQILKDSYKLKGKPIVISPAECQHIGDLYFSRYPGVQLWQRSIQQQIDSTQKMSCASGHERKFFGRAKDHATYMEAYAHEPQANTTWATNLALWRLWTDRENRYKIWKDGHVPSFDPAFPRTTGRNPTSFLIEPLHHVHDALCGQFHKSNLEWARQRIRQYFNNTLEIAGRQIVIPFEGAYGPSWGQLGEKYGGGTI